MLASRGVSSRAPARQPGEARRGQHASVARPELRAMRRLLRDYRTSPYVFTTERQGPLTTATVRKLIARAGVWAKIAFPVHTHMLRHACGFKLANDGQDTLQHYLGHRNIQHTVRYTEMAPDRFKTFWRTNRQRRSPSTATGGASPGPSRRRTASRSAWRRSSEVRNTPRPSARLGVG
jgi:integrase